MKKQFVRFKLHFICPLIPIPRWRHNAIRHVKRELYAIRHNLPMPQNRRQLEALCWQRYKQSEKALHNKIRQNKKINVTFLVSLPSMFPAENLMCKMLKDNAFNVKLFVIPDLRFGSNTMQEMYIKTFNELYTKYPFIQKSMDISSPDTVDCDIISDADIVCYPSPYAISYEKYNPMYAITHGILSIHVNYGFFRSKYDRKIYNTNVYNSFWRVFLETPMNMEEYKKFGCNMGRNAIVVGYSKMDSLAQYMIDKQNKRKRIIIAPHHSVDGGYNEMLALSNFERYSEFFLQLPKKYPNIDFVFRPHPMLFQALSASDKWGEKRVKKYITNICSNKNIIYSTKGDYFQEFAESDGIINDCGSFLVEYFYTGKPQCYMLKTPADIDNKFSQLGKMCLDKCYIAYAQNDIENFITNVIVKSNDIKAQSRQDFAADKIMVNFPNVSQKIIEHIKNI